MATITNEILGDLSAKHKGMIALPANTTTGATFKVKMSKVLHVQLTATTDCNPYVHAITDNVTYQTITVKGDADFLGGNCYVYVEGLT